MTERKKSSSESHGKNALEWAVFGLSSVLVAAMVTVLAIHAADWHERPPDLAASLGERQVKDGLVTFPVEVINRGDVAANQVEVEVARTSGSMEHRARVLLDFVPRHGKRRGQVSFPDAAEAGDPRIVGVGLAEP